MNQAAIEIKTFKVESDSTHLYMSFSCPSTYHFVGLQLEVKYLSESGNFVTKKFDLSAALFPGKETQTDWSVLLPLSKIDITSDKAMYTMTLKALLNTRTETDFIVATGIASDVNFAYKCMLEDLLKLKDCCELPSDELIRNYLILYGHYAALQEGEIETAELLFKLINQCFHRCERNQYSPTEFHTTSCNCK